MRPVFTMLSLMVVVVLVAFGAHAVIFASDTFYLYEDGARVEDNSVLMRTDDGRIDVCVWGKFEYGQQQGRVIMLYITDNPGNPTFAQWSASPEGQGKSIEEYKEVLETAAGKCLFSTKAILPERTDLATYDPPKEGMTGGRIGSHREFMLDIVSGKPFLVKDKELKEAEVKKEGTW